MIKLHWRVSGLLFWYLLAYLSWRYLCVFFSLSCWIVISWFLLTCSLILLYSVEGKFKWSFDSISFISCSPSLIVVSQIFIFIFISCFVQLSWILYRWLKKSLFWFPMVVSRLIFKPFGVNLSRKHFSKNSLCDKNWTFLFLIQSRQNASFFISSSLPVFLPWLLHICLWWASVLLSSIKIVCICIYIHHIYIYIYIYIMYIGDN